MNLDLTSWPRPTKTYHRDTYPRIAIENTKFSGKGKTVLITAGGTGIGFATSRAFAAAGTSRIVIVSRSAGPQATAKAALEKEFPGIEVVTRQISINDHEKMKALLHELGRVDVLVHSATAAHANVMAEASGTPIAEMQDIFDTNAVATFALMQAFVNMPAAPGVEERKFINISSAVVQTAELRQIGYAASKAAAAQIVQHFVAEQEKRTDGKAVKILSFHPGAHLTDVAVRVGFTKDSLLWDEIELPAHFAVWLATPEADFLTGRWVWAHWDVDELVALREKIEKDPSYLTIGLVQ